VLAPWRTLLATISIKNGPYFVGVSIKTQPVFDGSAGPSGKHPAHSSQFWNCGRVKLGNHLKKGIPRKKQGDGPTYASPGMEFRSSFTNVLSGAWAPRTPPDRPVGAYLKMRVSPPQMFLKFQSNSPFTQSGKKCFREVPLPPTEHKNLSICRFNPRNGVRNKASLTKIGRRDH